MEKFKTYHQKLVKLNCLGLADGNRVILHIPPHREKYFLKAFESRIFQT
jgi:hypothetical protein